MMSGRERVSAVKLALLGRKLWAQDSDVRNAEPIALVGMGCRIPGGANTPEALWQLLAEGRDVVSEVPADRWELDGWFDADPATPGRMSTRWGGFLDDVRGFDAAYFDISPREAERMDPQQRIALEVACEAFERAGIPLDALRNAAAGVFVASYHNDYTLLQYADPDTITARTLTGALQSIVSNRISYLLGLRGPSLTIDSACSSSLVAVHLACQSLRARDCDVALAGGVSVMATPHISIALSKGGFMSPTGRCHTFDAAADGFVRAEGCGMVVLKRLSDAIQAGDHVLAVIRGSAVNQDGESTTLSAPNGLAQEELVRRALRNAGVQPEDVSLIEAHGTGTELGDPIETDALTAALRDRDPAAGPCWLGSLKSNVGHLEAAAGVSGLIKTVLSLQHRTIPPQALFQSLNPHIDLSQGPLRIARDATAWDAKGLRVAGVSSFGVGGTNAHVVIEEAPPALQPTGAPAQPPYVLPISARSASVLRALCGAYAERLRTGIDAGAFCRAAARQRRHYADFRVAIVGATADALVQQLDAYARGERPIANTARSRRLAFVFTGQGSQWPGMAQTLFEQEPVFRDALSEAATAVRAAGGPDVLAEIAAPAEQGRLEQTDIAQAAIFAVQVALVRLLEAWGITPDAVVGHSIGELAAAVAAGVLDLKDAARAVVERGRLMQSTFDAGRMVSVRAPESAVRLLLQRHALDLTVAAVNGPTAIVLSGRTEEIDRAINVMIAEKVECTRLNVRFAFHSSLMSDAANAFENAVPFVHGEAAAVTFISTVDGAPLKWIDAAYLAENVRSPVRFASAIETALDSGITDFIEVGAHPALGRGITELAEARGLNANVAFCLHRERDHRLTLYTLVSQAYAWGADVEWSHLYPGALAHVDLPTYAWQHEPYWFPNAPDLSRPGKATQRGNTSFPGQRITSPALNDIVFELNLSDPVFKALSDHRINGEPRLPATGFAELIRSAAIASGVADAEVRALGILRPVRMGDDQRLQTVLTAVNSHEYSVSLYAGNANEWVRVATADVRAASRSFHEDPAITNGSKVSTETFYALLEQQGCDFGTGFRLLANVVAGEDGAEGSIQSNAAAPWNGAVHPAHVDAAAQLCIAALRERGIANEGGAFLPWSLDAYHVSGTAIPSHGRAALIDATSDAATFNVTLYAASGQPVVRLDGWRLRYTAAVPPQLRVIRWEAESVAAGAAQNGQRWLVFADAEGLGQRVAETLATRGVMITSVAPDVGAGPTNEVLQSLQSDPTSWDGVLLAVTPEQADTHAISIERVCRPALDIARRVAMHAAPGLKLLVVTRASQAVGGLARDGNAAVAAVWGIARVLRAERPDVHCVCLDLDAVPAGSGVSSFDVDCIVQEMFAPADSREVAIRDGDRLVAQTAIERWKQTEPRATHPVRLVHRAAGTLDGFETEPLESGPLPTGQVRIRVLAAGVNFRDVLTALGSYPGAREFGHECCGIVEAVASDVSTIEVGERVIAFWPGCFATSVDVPATHVFPAPDGIDPVGAATMPVAFGTAWYALFELGSIGAGDSVLIHSGAGGVGLAAIQLALTAGAHVFATAGTPARRRLLERLGVQKAFDSRSPQFAEALLDATTAEGVDLVLNSLIGPMIPAGLKVLKPGGVFVELGKREILSGDEVANHRADVRYAAFDLGDEARRDDRLLPRIFTSLNGMLAAGAIQPLPATVFPINEVEPALRRMSRGEHVGKTVFVLPPQTQRAFEGWIVVTGGSGGVGLATLRWLVTRGARKIALWSRRAPADDAAAVIAKMAESGADIRVMPVDVSRLDDVQAALHVLRAEAPVTGVIHAAGAVDDAMLPEQDWARFERVLGAKALGAWNLHVATIPDRIELFLLYSAAGPLIDAKGQANYAAANAYVDALASYRRARGLPANSVLWGPWRDAGMAARLDTTQQQRWTRYGLEWWTAESATATLDALLNDAPPQVLAVRVAGARAAHARNTSVAKPAGGLRERLEGADASTRIPMLLEHVRTTLAGLLSMPDGPAPDAPLRDAGLDSLTAIELRNALTLSVGTSLPATLAFDHPTAIAITTFLLRTMQLDAGVTVEVAEASVAPENRIRAEVGALTDEEAEAALLAELGMEV